jgi:hypothetical protein
MTTKKRNLLCVCHEKKGNFFASWKDIAVADAEIIILHN